MKVFRDEEKDSEAKKKQVNQAWQEVNEERVNDILERAKRGPYLGIIPYLIRLWISIVREK